MHYVYSKIVVTSDDRDITISDNLADKGVKNRLKRLKLLSPKKLKQRKQ